MKQKLKEKFNVGDKVKKPSFTKCVKMSKEVENLKNGILNGDSLINHIQHQQQKQSKLGNSNADREAKSIVGGRLQFYKGKYRISEAIKRDKAFVSRESVVGRYFLFLCPSAWIIFKKKIFILLCVVWCLFFRVRSLSLPLVSFPLFLFHTQYSITSISLTHSVRMLNFFSYDE
jgi:hypothetical protein